MKIPIMAQVLLATLVSTSAFAGKVVDLAGQWRFAQDIADKGGATFPEQGQFPDTIQLPGAVAAQGFGELPSFETAWTGTGWRYPQMFKEWQEPGNFKFPFFLQPPRHYLGPAWFQREIEIPADWNGIAVLHLERVHWRSAAWIDGKPVGKFDSLGVPHEFDLGALKPGEHLLTLRVDNRIDEINVGPLSHSVTDHTQGNWNGVVGKMEVREVKEHRISSVRVEPSFAGKTVKLHVSSTGNADATLSARIRYAGPLNEPLESPVVSAKLVAGKAEISIPFADPRPWNEFTPNLYTATVTLDSAGIIDERSETFGFRDPGHKDGRLSINGKPIFLRGTLESCIFPLTGYPPTDIEPWRRIIRICKAHGLNHIRFHSWCPPEAAFVAADEMGFYYQVEVSSWPNQGAEIGSGWPLDAWIVSETARMLAKYGNHPSFLLMAYGNEPSGDNNPKWLQEWVAQRKQEDPRRFYTTAAGWPTMPGSDFHNTPNPRIQGWGAGLKSIINGEAPRTDFDWSKSVKEHSDAPLVSHEIGQWCAYPNFEEIAKYTGYFKPRNLEIFRETARRAGLLDQSRDFLMASGKLQALAYKHDIEAALRTPGFGGFQLLDLHDFPGQGTALVGVLDAFWDEKGYISPEEYSRFCGPVVPLVRLPKMVYTTAEALEAHLEISQFGPEDLHNLTPEWKLTAENGELVAGGNLPPRDLASGALHSLGKIRVPLDKVSAPAKLKLTVSAASASFSNSWDIFVYPSAAEVEDSDGLVVTRDLGEAQKALADGKSVLWMPRAQQIANDPTTPLIPGFSPIFWNTAWTKWQPPHTLGILCDPKHPALGGFPTDFHSNWQWWELQQDAQPFILTEFRAATPVVQVIDDWFTNRKLGYVFETRVGGGKLLACAFDLQSNLAERPAARQLHSSLVKYMKSDRFNPAAEFEISQVQSLLRGEP
jgi:hypothetical protein